MIKVLLCRFQQCLGGFNVFSVKGYSETGLFRHLSIHVFRSPKFRKYIGYQDHLFFQNDVNFRITAKNAEKWLYLLDNCIWIGCRKFSLLRRKYLSSVVNVLTNSPKISHITNRDIFQLNFNHCDQKIW